jgi:rhodanese-related sulfurtransferase/predicted small lipoprotein YifL
MKMKKLYLPLALLLAFSMLLAACGSPAPVEAPAVEEPAAAAPVVEEPVAEEPMMEEADLDGAFGDMLANMAGYNTVKADALLVEMAEDNPPFLLDVRSAAELEESGHIEGATHIPLNELAQHIDLLPSLDTPIVAYCGTGWRATIAMTALHGMGWTNVRALKATFTDWVDAGNPVAAGVPEAMALNVAEPDAALVAAADAYLVGIMDHGVKFGVTTPEMLNSALAEDPDLVVIDVRKQSELDEQGTIDAPNLVTIPLEDFIARSADWPASDKSITIYCGSGHRSTMAMTMLFAYGYTDVTSLSGGFGGWKEAGYATVGGVPTLADNYSVMLADMTGYNTVKADALMVEMAEDTPPFLLDVRSAAELEENGHIEGATHIPLNELAQHLDLLPSFDTPIVAYCGSGWRATIAMTSLHAMGWTNVRALKTTFADWVAAGNPVVEGVPEPMVLDVVEVSESLTGPVDTAVNIAKDTGWGGKAAEDLNLALVDNPDMILIDVRTPEELAEKGVIAVEGQELLAIPLESFLAEKAMWPADKEAEIVVYCGSGHRSTMAMTMLLTEGYTNVTSLKGGFGGWVEAGFPVAEFVAP